MLRPILLTAFVLGLLWTASTGFATCEVELMDRAALEGIRAGADCSDFGVTAVGCSSCFPAPGPGGFFWQCNLLTPASDCRPITGPCVACVSGNVPCGGFFAGFVDAACTITSAPPPGNLTAIPCSAPAFAQSYKNAVGNMPCSLPGITCLDP